jgi:hypothetical protein
MIHPRGIAADGEFVSGWPNIGKKAHAAACAFYNHPKPPLLNVIGTLCKKFRNEGKIFCRNSRTCRSKKTERGAYWPPLPKNRENTGFVLTKYGAIASKNSHNLGAFPIKFI